MLLTGIGTLCPLDLLQSNAVTTEPPSPPSTPPPPHPPNGRDDWRVLFGWADTSGSRHAGPQGEKTNSTADSRRAGRGGGGGGVQTAFDRDTLLGRERENNVMKDVRTLATAIDRDTLRTLAKAIDRDTLLGRERENNVMKDVVLWLKLSTGTHYWGERDNNLMKDVHTLANTNRKGCSW